MGDLTTGDVTPIAAVTAALAMLANLVKDLVRERKKDEPPHSLCNHDVAEERFRSVQRHQDSLDQVILKMSDRIDRLDEKVDGIKIDITRASTELSVVAHAIRSSNAKRDT